MDCSPPGYNPWAFPSKNTRVGFHFLLQGILPTQGSNLHLQHLCIARQILYQLSYQGSPRITEEALKILMWGDSSGDSGENSVMSDSLRPLSMGFPREEYWSGLPCLSPGDLPDSGIEPRPLTLQADSLHSEPLGEPI